MGDLLGPGRESNFETGRVMNTSTSATLDAAVWGAELASGEGRGRIYIVEPTGAFEDDRTDRQEVPGESSAVVPQQRAAARCWRADRLGRSFAREARGHAAALDALQRNGSAQIED